MLTGDGTPLVVRPDERTIVWPMTRRHARARAAQGLIFASDVPGETDRSSTTSRTPSEPLLPNSVPWALATTPFTAPGARYLTVHSSGGKAMLSASIEGLTVGADRAGLPTPITVAVTVLTSDTDAPSRAPIPTSRRCSRCRVPWRGLRRPRPISNQSHRSRDLRRDSGNPDGERGNARPSSSGDTKRRDR